MSNTQPQQTVNNTVNNRQTSKSNVPTTPNGSSSSSSSSTNQSFVRKQNAKDKERERAEREKLVLWRHPILTLTYCCHEIVILLQTYRKKYKKNKFVYYQIIKLIIIF